MDGQQQKQAKAQGPQNTGPCDRPGPKLTENDGKNSTCWNTFWSKPNLLCLVTNIVTNRKRLTFPSLSLSLSFSCVCVCLQATQVNNKQKYSVVSVEIKVINKSDHAPYFESSTYTGIVSVGVAPRSLVFQVEDPSSPLMIKAADDDFPDVRN